jgi:hypothetical protein
MAGERYCSNCGHELGPDASFCPSCGRPVHHEEARRTASEAGGPTSPPAYQAGGAASPPPQAQQGGRSGMWRGVAIGCGISFVLFVALLLLFPLLMQIL